MKVGDLVEQISWGGLGIITEAETDGRIGHYLVLWPDGDLGWYNKKILRVVSESR